MNTNTKHTPGPWNVAKAGDIRDTMGNQVCAIYEPFYRRGDYPPDVMAIREANARLIAAAPELLNYLKSATAWIRKAGGDCSTLDTFLSQFD